MKKNTFYGENWVLKKHFLTFTLSVNKIIIYQLSMFKSLDYIAPVVGICMYLTISNIQQVLRSRKGLDYNTAHAQALWLFFATSDWVITIALYRWVYHLNKKSFLF